MSFDLKHFRQNVLKMTQQEFAQLIDVRQDNVSRMEKTPEAIDVGILVKIANATGTTLDELVGYKQSLPEALAVENAWKDTASFKNALLQYIHVNRATVRGNSQNVDDLLTLIQSTVIKPTVAVVGMSDAGKSRLINSLIGTDKMPTSWTPTTSISIHIKHIEDRPEFIKDEVWIFSGDKNGFDTKRIHDESYCKRWLLASGSAEMLSKYGTRQGDKYDIEDASAAVVFVDSSILHTCDIVDLPGFGTGDRKNDDILAQKSHDFADIVIYLSIANGFLRSQDIEFLKSTLNSLPVIENKRNKIKPLNNLFVLASQAHTVNNGSQKDLENILGAGANRLYNSIPEEIFKNRSEQSSYEHSEKVLRNRFYTYTTDKPYLRESFEAELRTLLEQLPILFNKEARRTVEEYVEEQKEKLVEKVNYLKDINNKNEEFREMLEKIKENEPLRINENEQARIKVVNKIKELHKKATKDFRDTYSKVISVDNIAEIIEKKSFKKKKDDMELLTGYLGSQLQAQIQNILKEKSEELNSVIDKYLDNFEIQIHKIKGELGGFNIPFDTVRVFASGLAGLATFGGLAIWASTLGNLGAYILVAKGVSVLSALGISVAGGTAGAASMVAAIGGPVTLAIALAVIVSFSIFAFSRGGWKKSVAKKIVKEYSKQAAIDKFTHEIDKFWKDTETAFDTAADYLEQEWQKYVADLDEKVHNANKDTIVQDIANIEQLYMFYHRLPLNVPNGSGG